MVAANQGDESACRSADHQHIDRRTGTVVIPTDSTMLTKSFAMQTMLTTSWITISTAEKLTPL